MCPGPGRNFAYEFAARIEACRFTTSSELRSISVMAMFQQLSTSAACALDCLISFFECLKTIPNSLQRVDTAGGCVSSAEVSSVSGDGFLSLPGPFVNLRDAAKAISDERPGALDTLATLPIGKPVFPPTDEP